MFVAHIPDEQPISRLNVGDRAQGITATLIERWLTADRIMQAALFSEGCSGSATIVGVPASRDMVRMLVLRGRTDRCTVMIKRRRLCMTRSGAACESKRNGNG